MHEYIKKIESQYHHEIALTISCNEIFSSVRESELFCV